MTSSFGRKDTVESSDERASQPLVLPPRISSQPRLELPSTQAWTADSSPVTVTGVPVRSRPLVSWPSSAVLASTSSIETPEVSVFHVSVSTQLRSIRWTSSVAPGSLGSAATKVNSAETMVAPVGIWPAPPQISDR